MTASATSPAADARSRELIRPVPATWWLKRGVYVRFMLREWTCVPVAAYAYFLLELMSKAKDRPALDAFCAALKHPGWIALHVLCLVAVCYHAATFFTAAGKVLVVRRGEDRVPPAAIAGAHYAAWLVASVVIAVLVWIA